MHRQTYSLNLSVFIISSVFAAGCLSGGGADEPDVTGNLSGPTNPANSAPTIAGTPGGSTKIGEPYSFRPSASDPDGDTLTFSIENLPRWASFSSADGTLSGTPQPGDEGTYSNIRIAVSDGNMDASLPPFSVSVTQIANGSAILSWTAPTENSDGSALTDLAGYRVYYGLSQGNYPNRIQIDNPGVTSYVLENLSPNTYYFVSTAFNELGIESNYSNVAVKTVN